MYTRRSYSFISLIVWTRRYIYRILLISVLPVVLYQFADWKWLHLPWLPIGLLGTAVAFIVGFKNNASYGRLWEARKIYGGIVNASRSYALMVNDFITNKFATGATLSETEFQTIRRRLILRHVAWMTCLRHNLRQKKPWEHTEFNKSDQEYMEKLHVREYAHSLEEELTGYVTEAERSFILAQRNKQAACLNLQSEDIRKLFEAGYMDDFRHMEFQHMMTEFFSLQGKAERIKNFPYPRQFATLNLLFTWIFIILLPFGIMHEFDKIGQSLLVVHHEGDHNLIGHFQDFIYHNFVWLSVPFSLIISWVFFTIDRIGDVSENPFEGNPNDIPITTMSRAIEIDIRQIIRDNPEDIPEALPAVMDVMM